MATPGVGTAGPPSAKMNMRNPQSFVRLEVDGGPVKPSVVAEVFRFYFSHWLMYAIGVLSGAFIVLLFNK